MAINTITSSSAAISWTSGGATNWQIEYGPNGFTPGTGTIVNANTNPFTLAGLNPSTAYEVRVRDSCGVGDVSFWSALGNFKTTCAVAALPWSDNFESSDWVASTFGNTGSIDTCYTRNFNNTFTWEAGPPQFQSNFSGPSGDHTTGSGKYMFTEVNGFVNPDTAIIISPPLDLSTVTQPEMSFWYHMYGNSIGNLAVRVSNDGGASYTSVFTRNGQQQNSQAAPWQEAIVNLSAYANDTVLIQFRVIQSAFGTNGDVAIDDLVVQQQPACPKPSNLQVSASTTSSITLSWTSGGATDWQVEYGPPGFTIGNGTIVNSASNPFTINGLSASTSYDFYVRDSCGAAGVSVWSTKVRGTTKCAVVSAPYLRTFNGPNFDRGVFVNDPGTIDTCWDRTPLNDFFFKTGPPQFTFNTGADVDHTTGTTSGKYLYTERTFFSAQGDTTELHSPLIDLSPLTTPELSFWYHMYGADIGVLNVLISDDNGASYNNVYTRSGQHQGTTTDPWKEAIINLSAYADDTIIVKFEATHIGFGTTAHTCLDDFDVHEAPTCPKPQDLAVDMVWHDHAVLSWTTGGAAQWEIEYGGQGFTPGSGTQISMLNNPGTISGLSPNTTYDAYVRDSCAPGDASVWVGPVTFRTKCLPATTPYTEDFSGSGFSAGTFFNDPGSVDACWARDPEDEYVWKGGPPVFTSFNTGPDKDHTTGLATGKYLFTATIGFSGTLPLTTNAYSELIDASSLTTPELSFWYHMFGADIGTLEVAVTRGDGIWNTVFTKTGQEQTSKSEAWKEVIVDLSAYSGDTIQLLIRATKNVLSNQTDIAIDDISVHEQPSCPKPQNLAIVGKTNSSIVLQWQSGGATNWNVEYGSPGFTPGNGTMVNTTANPFTLTGLSANTAYDIYVRDSCGVGDVSVWVGPVRDTTDCNPIAAPYTENFDGSDFTLGSFFAPGNINACWSRPSGLSYVWTPETNNFNFGTGPDADHTSGNGQYLNADRLFGTVLPTLVAEIESPLIDLSPLNIPELSFWYHMFGTDIDSLVVEVFDGATWSQELKLTGQQQNAKNDPWKEAIVNISGYVDDTIKVRFRAYQNNIFGTSNNTSIDDIDIHEQPSCPKPSQLVLTASTANSVTLSWTSGGATNWQVEYGLSGFTPGTGTIVNANTNPFAVTGLNSSTTYDFYVRDSCGAGDVSQWLGPISGTTDCLPLLAPFTESFDGSQWFPGVNFNDTGSVANCWNRTPLFDYLWKPGPPPFAPFGTGPSADHTSGSGKYLFTESIFSGGTAPFTAFVESPEIDLSALTTPQLNFWYHMYGFDIGTLVVEVDDGNGYTSVFTRTGEQQISSTEAWEEAIVSLAAYANDTIRLRFKGTKSTFGARADVAIDDVWIGEAPSCPRPDGLAVSNTSSTSVTLSWTSGGASNWLVGYKATGATGPLTIVPAGTNPFTITGLNPSTSYTFYVKDSCAANDVSVWHGPVSGSTLCGIITAPWNENFDGSEWVSGSGAGNLGNQISQCWSRPNTNNPHFGTRQGPTTSVQTGPNGDVSGTGNYIYTEASGASGTGSITSPLIYIPSGLINPRLKFSYHMYGANITSFSLQINGGSGFTNVLTLNGPQQNSNAAAWLTDSVTLNSYAGDTIQFRLNGTNTGFNGDICIDELIITADPSGCSMPAALSFSGITGSSAVVSWNSGSGMSDLEVVPQGQGQGTGDMHTNVSSPYTVNGLSPATTYTVYVRDSCGPGSNSNWISGTFTTSPCPVPVAAFFFNTNVLNVSFNSSSSINADTLIWAFGDGNITSGANPTHSYAAAGTYQVSLIAGNFCGTADTLTTSVTVCDSLLAIFNTTQAGDTVYFDASASKGASNFYWDLGDGTDTTGVQFGYIYTGTSNRTVTLIVTNACGDTSSTSQIINICLPPIASWTYTIISSGGSGMNVQFDGSASKNATSFKWDFGDGNKITGPVQPVHTYLTPGLFYRVTLTVGNACGDESSYAYRLSEIGLEELTARASVQMYPNPADDRLTIEWDHTEFTLKRVEIVDASGKRMLRTSEFEESLQGEMELDVSSLADGYYIIRFTGASGVSQQKLTIR